jgi:glycosyltransferase involved in cell wall biosynthesis
MKICYIGDGKNIHTQRWVSFFAKRGHEVILLTERFGNIAGVEEIVFTKQKYFPMTALIQETFKVSHLVKEIKPEILHAHYAPVAGWYGAFSGFHPYVLTVWGSDVFRPKFTNIQRINYALRKANLVTGDSQSLLESAIKLGANKEKTVLIQFGVDTDLFKPNVDSTFWRKELGIEEEKVIFSPRNINPIYNIDIIVKAFYRVYENDKNCVLILKKYLQSSESPYETHIKTLIDELGIKEKVKFVGTIDYNEMPGLYNLADAVVSIPSSDATPMSVLEAMSCEAKIVVSDLPSLREWIQDGYNGFIVPSKDELSTFNAILKCLQNPSGICDEFSNRNRSIILKKADHTKNMEKMENLYYNLWHGSQLR